MKDRDELVFQYTRERNIPVVMVTSGGYQRNNADVIARSILNLNEKNLIPGPSIVSETDEAASHLVEVAGQMEEEAAAKKPVKKKGKVRSADGRGDEGKMDKPDKAASMDEDNPGDLVGGRATGVASKGLERANLAGKENSTKGTGDGYWTPEEDTDGEDAGVVEMDTATTNEQ